MANITSYIQQIQNAVYGEEVRSSIVNALEKINDDNESNQILQTEIKNKIANIPSIYIQSAQPTSPSVGDLWFW